MTQMMCWRQRLPYLLIIGWLVFLGVTHIVGHAIQEDQPPIYDSSLAEASDAFLQVDFDGSKYRTVITGRQVALCSRIL